MTEPQDPANQNPGNQDPYAAPPPGQGPPPGQAPPPGYAQPPGQPAYAPPPYGQPAYGQPGYAQPAYAPPGGGNYANWLQRVGAYLIDAILTGVPVLVLVLIGAAIGGGFGVFVVIVGYLAGLAVFIWNTVLRQGRTGQSIGKEQLHLRLIREADGQPVGPGMSFVRQLAHILDGFCYIGYLWPLWDSKRQTFADKVCSTVVVVVS